MNEFAGYTVAVPGGHWGMLRLARDGKPKPIMSEGQKPRVFATELEAQKAVTHHLLAYFNGDYRRDGVIMEAHSAGEQLFKPIFRKGKKIEVERRRIANA